MAEQIAMQLSVAESLLGYTYAGRRAESGTEPGSESSVTGISVENETGIEIYIDRCKRRKSHSTFMFVQLHQH
ncbi:hypothetical protein EVAR_27601_1 [Eumeta japonica]|uniref:Uncharacterized protein n=1 Tax=Eumeta variegata TaxID=151549 RepID=A0A4C1V0B3_EUMVA|nr:hypothetical protein EVAR_27601_1 [Eumeta japonica]